MYCCLGATCYLNSLLQSLFLTPALRKALFQFRYDESKHGKRARCVPLHLQELFARLQLSSVQSVTYFCYMYSKLSNVARILGLLGFLFWKVYPSLSKYPTPTVYPSQKWTYPVYPYPTIYPTKIQVLKLIQLQLFIQVKIQWIQLIHIPNDLSNQNPTVKINPTPTVYPSQNPTYPVYPYPTIYPTKIQVLKLIRIQLFIRVKIQRIQLIHIRQFIQPISNC